MNNPTENPTTTSDGGSLSVATGSPLSGAELIAAERKRQITSEGWTPEHDDQHSRGELARAADSYRIYTDRLLEFGDKLPACFIPKQWPWERQWWKPSKDPVRNLVKAGALYQAQADFFRRHNRPDELDIAENFCVRLIAEKIDGIQKANKKAQPHGPNTINAFDKCIRRKRRSTGMLLIECRLGLWSVEGPDHAFVEQNARHYWVQYHADGEYAALLSNDRGVPCGGQRPPVGTLPKN